MCAPPSAQGGNVVQGSRSSSNAEQEQARAAAPTGLHLRPAPCHSAPQPSPTLSTPSPRAASGDRAPHERTPRQKAQGGPASSSARAAPLPAPPAAPARPQRRPPLLQRCEGLCAGALALPWLQPWQLWLPWAAAGPRQPRRMGRQAPAVSPASLRARPAARCGCPHRQPPPRGGVAARRLAAGQVPRPVQALHAGLAPAPAAAAARPQASLQPLVLGEPCAPCWPWPASAATAPPLAAAARSAAAAAACPAAACPLLLVGLPGRPRVPALARRAAGAGPRGAHARASLLRRHTRCLAWAACGQEGVLEGSLSTAMQLASRWRQLARLGWTQSRRLHQQPASMVKCTRTGPRCSGSLCLGTRPCGCPL